MGESISTAGVRDGFKQILREMRSINNNQSAGEQQRQLEFWQKAATRVYIHAARNGLLPTWISLPEKEDEPLLPVWERLARALEKPFVYLPRVDEIADGSIRVNGTTRAINVSPPERIDAWKAHACGIVRRLLKELPAEQANAENGVQQNRAGSGGERIPTRPAWERLMIVKSDTGDDLACLDGKEYRLTGARDAQFLEQLQQQKGKPILAVTLESNCGERPARIYGRLAEPLQRIIDKPGQRRGKKGYRML